MTTAVDMVSAESGGVIAEDVMRKLYNLSPVDRPFIDSIGTESSTNPRKEFTDEVLAAASADNAYYENEDLTAVDDNVYGLRYGNFHQNMIKVVKLSMRGRASRTTYDQDEFLKQVMSRQKELKRDEEAAAVSRNAAVAEVKATTASKMAGAACWCIHNTQRGTSGADAELDGTTNVGGVPTTGPTEGESRGLTEVMIRTAIRGLYDDGADPTHLMSTPEMIEGISNYMFTSSARIATLQSQAPQGNRTMTGSGNGAGGGGVVAQGSVNMFISNFGTVILTPNRFMSVYDSGDTTPVDVVDVLLYDSRYPKMSYLQNYRTDPLAKTGLFDQTALSVDATFIPCATHAMTTIADILPGTAVADE